MKTFNSSADLIKDWNIGQGKTIELADIASLSENKLTYGGYTVEVTPVWQEAALLMYLHKELKTKPVDKQRATLNIFAQNRLSDKHKFDSDSNKVIDKPLPNHYLTSIQQRDNYFALVETDTVASIYHLLADATSATTKEHLLALITTAKQLIITDSQAETLVILEAKESALSVARQQLESVGCTDIKYTSETSLSAIVDFELVSKVKAIDGLRYDSNKSKLLANEQLLVNLELAND